MYDSQLVNGATSTDAGDTSASHVDASRPDASTDAMAGDAGASTPFDPTTCAGGDCWWSTAPADGCRSASAPNLSERPGAVPNDGSDIQDIYLGMSQIHVGESQLDGTMSDDAWQTYGLDLDGVCTNSSTCMSSSSSCKSAGSAVPYDGQLCRDNTLGRLEPVVAKVPEIGGRFGVSEAAFNCALWNGDYNMIFRVSGYNGKADDSQVRVDFYNSNGLEHALPWSCPHDKFMTDYPIWRTSETWRIDAADLTGPIGQAGSLPKSMMSDPTAYVKDGYLVAQVPDGARQGFIGNDAPYRGFDFKTHGGLVVGNLVKLQDGTWSIRDGLLAGRITKEDLAQAFREIGFCEAGDEAMFYQTMVSYLNDNADVLANGTVDPEAPCDAISYGIGFSAAQVTPGQATVVRARVECCAPGKTPDECAAKCGDGKVSGDETCDSAIADGAAGACPRSCQPVDACTPQALSGTDCAVHCVAMPITQVGPKDGCCPSGANASNDPDCKPLCGNGVLEQGETCDPAGSCAACTSSDPCLTVKASGAAESCDLRCDSTPITRCTNGDKCCPAGCSHNNDLDCSSSCGNMKIDPGETCENNTSKPCPSSCDDKNPCTIDTSSGSAQNCNISCTHVAITQFKNGDQCCPPGANATTDSDCSAQCGNHIVELGEQCDDGNQVANDGCTDCKTDSQMQICLAKLNSTDACAMCTCMQCTNQALACQGASSATDAMVCDAMVQCGRSTGCRNPNCLCGTTDIISCTAGINLNGPCKSQVIAAAETNVTLAIVARATDTNYPLGRANALGSCVDMNCASQCAPMSP